jgi:hypothetical protein
LKPRTLPQREKDTSGLADVPGGAKGRLLEVEYAFTEDRKLRGQLRDPSAIEAQVRACVCGMGLGGHWPAGLQRSSHLALRHSCTFTRP